MCMLFDENSVKVHEVWIFNKAICTIFWNGGSIRQLRTLTWKFYVSEEWLFCQMPWQNCHRQMQIWRFFGRSPGNGLWWTFARYDLRTHALHWHVNPPSHAHTHLTTLSRLLAHTIYLYSVGRHHTHICALHTLPSELLKNKRRHTFWA
jgi:hypothetical protein